MTKFVAQIGEREWLDKIERKAGESYAVLVYTPMCGTCKLALRMVDIVLQTGLPVQVYAARVHDVPRITRLYEIRSVPCLMTWKGGELIRQVYAMRSVDSMYGWLREIASSGRKAD